MGVLCCHFRPKMFSPGDHVRYHSRTLGAHVLATVVGPSPNGTQFCHIRYIRPGGVTPVDHESAQLSRLAPQLRGKPAGLAVQAGAKAAAKPAPRAIASSSTRKSLHTCSLCLRQWRVPQFALRYPCNAPPPPPGHRHLVTVSPPHPGDRRALPRDFARGGEGTKTKSVVVGGISTTDRTTSGETLCRLLVQLVFPPPLPILNSSASILRMYLSCVTATLSESEQSELNSVCFSYPTLGKQQLPTSLPAWQSCGTLPFVSCVQVRRPILSSFVFLFSPLQHPPIAMATSVSRSKVHHLRHHLQLCGLLGGP